MTSSLVQETRRAWFCDEDSLVVTHPVRGDVTVRREDIAKFGGPRVDLTCEPCAVMDWLSRIDGKSRFAPHACADPERTASVEQACQRIESDEWYASRMDYDFTLGVDPSLPGLRGLKLTRPKGGFVTPGDHKGRITFRQRYSRFQMDAADHLPADLSKYDFLTVDCGGFNDAVRQAIGRVKVLFYGHDHYGRSTNTDPQFQEALDLGADALLTPIPHNWTSAYRIPPKTKVVFMPYLSPTWAARPITDFDAKRYDVMVVGAVCRGTYPERHRLAQVMSKAITHPQRAGRWILDTGTQWHQSGPEPCSRIPGGRTVNAWDAFLAQSRIVAFGQDRWGYLVMKYSEVLANCSLLVAPDVPDTRRLGLGPNTHFVPLARPVEKRFVPQMTDILANWAQYEPIARAGFEWHRTNADRLLFDKFYQDVVSIVKGD